VATLSEADSKALLRRYGIATPAEALVSDATAAVAAAERIGYPVAVKLCGASIAHKTERGVVQLGMADAGAVERAATTVLARATPEDGEVGILVSEMVPGIRELIAGVVRDPQFGPCVMLGVGGVLTEVVGDVAFRVAPLTAVDAHELIEDLRSQALLGPVRGEPPVDRDRLAELLTGLGRLVADDPSILSVDVNPVIVARGIPIAVDALVER
jgi:acetyl-CoA synthetase (ADP-forming)